jgi:hypothetical protein
MSVSTKAVLAAALFSVLSGSPLAAQVLHVNDRWKDCAFVIDPSLTQNSWRQFVGELGQVTYFRPLASARPLGRGHFEVATINWSTKIDDADDAWNDTFTHPDSTHHLVDGHALEVPGLMLRAGLTDRIDVGAYYTKAIHSNWALVGAQVQYNMLNDAEQNLAAAGRVSVTRLFGPEDLTMSVYGLEFLASKDVSVFSPYAGVSGYLARGAERTSKVDLENENVSGVQAMAGVAARLSILRIAAEASLAKVPGYSFKIALGF